MGARLTFNHFLLFFLLYLTIRHEIYQTAEQNRKVPNTNTHACVRTHEHTHTYTWHGYVNQTTISTVLRKYESLYSVMESLCIP